MKLIEAALQFALGHPAVKTVIPGANAPDQISANLRHLEAKIPVSLWSDLKAEGLLRSDAPVPSQ
jgi:D-threo-aldose 1-dehydrogenase